MGIPGKECAKTHEGIRTHWTIFFIDGIKRPWYQHLGITKRGFEHVFAVQYNPHGGTFLLLDWTVHGLDLVVIDSIDLHHLTTWAEAQQTATIVGYEVPRVDIEQKPIKFLPMNCVLFLIHGLKLNANWIYTPYQLYKHLMKTGGIQHG